jgi:predicted O-methyltransferase YrrM
MQHSLRDLFKQNLLRIHDTFEYAHSHPYSLLRKDAHTTTVAFVRERCRGAVPCRSPEQLIDLALSRVQISGSYLEFGVYRGASLRYMAARLPQQEIHGFDSFEGLPEDWLHNARATFSTGGQLPKVPNNVKLWKGYFEDTLPGWVAQFSGPVAFAHIDCDLGSSTATIFHHLAPLVRPGTVLLFDDYFNFPYWEDDGHAVLERVSRERQWRLRYLGYGYKELAVMVL